MPATFQGLFRDHREELHQLAFHVLHSADAADDVVQTVFLRLLRRNAQTLRITPGYLHRAVWNAALDFQRAERYRRNGRAGWGAHRKIMGALTTHSEKELDQKRIAGSLAHELEELPESQKEALNLVYLEGYTNKEAAAELSISLEGLQKRLYRARQRLGAQLEERGLGSLDEFLEDAL